MPTESLALPELPESSEFPDPTLSTAHARTDHEHSLGTTAKSRNSNILSSFIYCFHSARHGKISVRPIVCICACTCAVHALVQCSKLMSWRVLQNWSQTWQRVHSSESSNKTQKDKLVSGVEGARFRSVNPQLEGKYREMYPNLMLHYLWTLPPIGFMLVPLGLIPSLELQSEMPCLVQQKSTLQVHRGVQEWPPIAIFSIREVTRYSLIQLNRMNRECLSETGELAPESFIFGALFNGIAAISLYLLSPVIGHQLKRNTFMQFHSGCWDDSFCYDATPLRTNRPGQRFLPSPSM